MYSLAFAGGEVKVNVIFSAVKGSLNLSRAYGQIAYDLITANPNAGGVTMNVTTNPTAIPVGSVATNGWGFFHNLSTNAVIQIGPGAGTAFAPTLQLTTNAVAVGPLVTNALYAALPASFATSNAVLEFLILDY